VQLATIPIPRIEQNKGAERLRIGRFLIRERIQDQQGATNLLTRTIVSRDADRTAERFLIHRWWLNPRPTRWGDQSPNEDDCLAGMPKDRRGVGIKVASANDRKLATS